MALYHRRDRPPSECASAIAATSPRDRRRFWRTTLSPTRGSYCFIPSDRDDDFSPEVFSADAPDRALLREGWRKLLPRAIADPLNPHSWRADAAMACPPGCRRPRAAGWDPLNEAHPAARCLEWRSARLGNHRRVWITPPARLSTRKRGRWRSCSTANSGPRACRWSPLAALTREGRLPPAVYLLIDAIDNQRRGVELPCHRDFWLAVQEELLPLVHGYARSTTARIGRWWPGKASAVWRRCSPLSTGRSALAACSASQAPTGGRTVMAAGRALSANSFAGEVSAAGLRVWLEAGQREPIIFARTGATGATHHNTADDFLASG